MADAEFPELEQRLRAYGGHAVDPAVQSQHLTAIATAAPARRRSSLAHKIRVAGALVGGFFLGSTGLAFAGALPDTAQDVAQEAFGRVGIEIEGGTERFQGGDLPGGGSVDCGTPPDGGQWRNHGHYVRSQPKDGRDAAGESPCGKPLVSLAGDDEAEEIGSDGAEHECAEEGKAVAEANRGRRGKPQNPGRPDHAGQPDTTGRPECTPEGEGSAPEAAEEGDANDAVTEPQPESTPAEPEARPVEPPVTPPAEPGDDPGDTQGVKGDTPGAGQGDVPEEPTTTGSEAGATTATENDGEAGEETPPED